MRLLHVTDFHFRQHWYEWLAAKSRDVEICCLSGDLLDLFPRASTPLHTQARWVRGWIKDFPGRLLVCTGNHDWWTEPEHCADTDALGGWLRKAKRDGISVDGTLDEFAGYHVHCCPWAGAPLASLSQPNLLIVHAPPVSTAISCDLGNEVGDPDVAKAAQSLPSGSLVLCGHIHNPKSWQCRLGVARCFNPGVDFEAPEPNHIIIDTDARTADFSGWGKHVQARL